MLRAIVISPSTSLRRNLEARIAESGFILVLRSFDRYLSVEEVQRLHRAHSPQVVFLDLSTDPSILAGAAEINRCMPSVPIVAIAEHCDPVLLLRLMHAGIRELLYQPFEKEPYLDALSRLMHAAREAPPEIDSTDLMFAFFPAKAGSGCSTVAANAAASMARSAGEKVLLADFDLSSGIMRFLFKLSNPFSIGDALARAQDLDDGVWDELVCHAGQLDVLAAGRIQPPSSVTQQAVRLAIESARRRYHAIFADLSGNLEEFSIEVMREAKRIFIVVHPDLASVYLAREKLRYLQAQDLEDRTSLVLNRWRRDACLTISDIESVVGVPVQYTFGDETESVYRALLGGTPVEADSALGRQFQKFVASIAGPKQRREESAPKKRMVEYFSLVPGRYSLPPGGDS